MLTLPFLMPPLQENPAQAARPRNSLGRPQVPKADSEKRPMWYLASHPAVGPRWLNCLEAWAAIAMGSVLALISLLVSQHRSWVQTALVFQTSGL